MANDNEIIDEGEAAGDGPGGPSGDLNDALATGESEFYSEETGKKGNGSLVLFALVGAAAAGTYFMYWKTGPKAASAATPEVAAAQTTIDQFLKGGDTSLKSMEEMRKRTEKIVARFLNPNIQQVPVSALRSNPFRMTAPVATPDATDAAAKRRREQEREVAIKAVGDLTLQSVMVAGTRSACMINKTLYTEGQQVDIFTIERITKQAVVVNANGFRFELKMTK